jgi:hypothetical protein
MSNPPVQISGHPDDHLVTFTYKVSASLNNVKIPAFTSRTFSIIVDWEEWRTGQILSPQPWGREEISNQLSALRPHPHFTQFLFTYSAGEIPMTSRTLPPGHITVVRARFPIKRRLELFSKEAIQDNMHAGMSVQDSWERLHLQVPRLYPHATFNYAGFVKPSLIVTAEVLREDVTILIAFEVKDNGWIEFPNNVNVSNWLARQEIYDHYAGNDPRIPPLAEYIEEDTRPYRTGVPVCFNLKAHTSITDRSDEGPGRFGGGNGTGIRLPAIKYGTRPINTTDPSNPKVVGSLKSTLVLSSLDDLGDDSNPTDSMEDETGETHRLARIALVLHNQEPVMVIFVGHFEGYQEIQAQCEFRLTYNGPAPPTLKEFFNFNWARIRDAASKYGSTSVPGSLLWTIQPITDDSLDISVYRSGMGLKVRYIPKNFSGFSMERWPTVITFDLDYGLSIAFPAVPRLPDAFLMQYAVNLTVPWDGHEFGKPWQVYLTQQPWRKSETGEIYLQALPQYPGDMNPEVFNPRIPVNAAQSRDFSEITNSHEISRILKFGRDNGWDMLLSCVSSLDGSNFITVTYQTVITDCEDSIPWYIQKFNALMKQDGLIGLPAPARNGIVWTRSCRIEDHNIHIFLTEVGVSTPEEDGPPCTLLYAPRGTFKPRCESIPVALRAITMCYGREPDMPREHHTKEWELIAAIPEEQWTPSTESS